MSVTTLFALYITSTLRTAVKPAYTKQCKAVSAFKLVIF